MGNKSKLGVILAVAFVAGILSAVSFFTFEDERLGNLSQTNTNPNSESLGLGAMVTIQAYHEDGTLFYESTKHNLLGASVPNLLASCLTGMELTPHSFTQCNGVINGTQLTLKNQTTISNDLQTEGASVALYPLGCTPGGPSNLCSGFNVTKTWDFDTLDCTPDVNCYNATSSGVGFAKTNAGEITGYTAFNNIQFDEEIPIGPNDRLQIALDFDIPR